MGFEDTIYFLGHTTDAERYIEDLPPPRNAESGRGFDVFRDKLIREWPF